MVDSSINDAVAFVVAHDIMKGEKCPSCNKEMDKYKLKFQYKNGERTEDSELYSMRCKECNKIYVSDKVYRTYVRGKSPENLSIEFKK